MPSLSLFCRIGAGVLAASFLALGPIAAAPASAHSTTAVDRAPALLHSAGRLAVSTGGRFSIGSGSVGGGTGAVLPDGTIVTAYVGHNDSRIDVCTMSPNPTKCSATPVLDAYQTDSFGVPQVVPTGGKDVSIVVDDCCYIGDDGIVVFNSTNDGKTFSNYKIAGNLPGIASAAYAGDGHIVIVDGSTGTVELQEISDNPSAPTGVRITPPHEGYDENSSVTPYKGGVLLATTDDQATIVDYAKAGSNYAKRGSWKKVATLRQTVVAEISGNAILEAHGGSITGAERVQFFNGSSFGPGYRVSQPPTPDDGGFVMEETGSVAHVFYVARRESYRLYETSTSNGTWSHQTAFASVINNSDFAPALGADGKGVVLITGGPPAIQTITNGQ